MRDSSNLDPLFQAAGEQYGIDPNLLKAVAKQESGINPAIHDSYQGAQGLMQILPSTARGLGINDPRDPLQAIPAAAKYLAEGFAKTGSPEGAVMYYHGGPDQRQWGPKTHAYVQAVGAHYDGFSKGSQMASKPAYIDDLVRQYGAPQTPATAQPDQPAGISPDDISALVKTYGVAPKTEAQPAAAPSGPVVPPQPPRVITDASGNEMPAAPLTADDIAAIKAAPQNSGPVARINSKATAKDAATQAAQYVGGQVAAVPGQIATDYGNARDMVASGLGDVGKGQYLPSFPSSDPSTWAAGGALKTVAGLAGMVGSPVSGMANKLVQDPVTQASGNPDIGLRAGVVANAAIPNMLAAKFGGSGVASPETLRLARVAEQNGIPIRASQISTNPLVNKLDQAAGWIPGSGRASEDAAQQSAFTRSVAKTFGENTDQITRTTVANAQRNIGDTLNTIEARTPIKFDSSVMDKLGAIESDAKRSFTDSSPQFNQIKNQIDQIVNVAAEHNGVVPGDVWAKFSHYKSPLSRLADSADTDVGGLAGEIKGVMQDAVQKNAAPGDAAAYTKARLQYKNLKTVEPLVTKGTPGEISPLGLNQRVNQKFGTTNAGQLGELADAAQRFMRPPRDSGSPLGNLAINMLTAPGTVIGGAMSGAGYMGGISPAMMAAGAAGGITSMGVSRLASAVLNNPIYRNALLSGEPGTINKLIYGAIPNAPTNPPQLERKSR